MPIEKFTYVGMQLPQLDWIFPTMLLLLIPLSRIMLRRIVPFAIVLPLFGLGLYFLRVPTLPCEVLDLAAVVVGFSVLTSRRTGKSVYPDGVPATLIPMLFTILVPQIAIWITTSHSSGYGEQIALYDTRLVRTERMKETTINRNALELALWPPSTYAYQDSKQIGGLLMPDMTYWSSHFGFLTGDEVARRIATWSGCKPRIAKSLQTARGDHETTMANTN